MSEGASIRFMQGNEAVAEGCLAAGLQFYAGYPITPSSEIAEILSRRLPQTGGIFLQMEDEIGSMAAVIGASVGGAKATTATSGPGFSLMQENIGYAAATEIPSAIINVQRAGPSTGQPTSPSQADLMRASWGTHGDHPIIAVYPSSVREAFDQTVRAFKPGRDVSDSRYPALGYRLIEGGIKKKGFGVVGVLSHCHVAYGSLNQMGSAADMLRWFKENTLLVNSIGQGDSDNRLRRGVCVDKDQPEYTEQYRRIIELAQSSPQE